MVDGIVTPVTKEDEGELSQQPPQPISDDVWSVAALHPKDIPTQYVEVPRVIRVSDKSEWMGYAIRRRKLSAKRMIRAFILTAFIICASLGILGFIRRDRVPPTVAVEQMSPAVINNTSSVFEAGLPLRIKIPKIDINAPLEYKGLTSSGDLDVPEEAENAAWYNLGPRPGEIGSAIIDGHFGYENQRPAVFDYLHTLKRGDLLYVEDDTGQTITFEVKQLSTYGPDEKPKEVFNTQDGQAHLNIVTCAGSWDKKRRTYSKRLVVFSDRKI